MERRLLTDEQLERICKGAVRVLCEMGMKVENRECLEAMERFGCKIDYPNERAIFTSEIIARIIEIVRAQDPEWTRQFRGYGPGVSAGASGTCPFYLDEEVGRRRATEEDCIRMFKVGETCGLGGVSPLVSAAGNPPKFEAIRIVQLGIETLNKAVAGGTDLFFAEQIPFAAELGVFYKNDPRWFISAANCPTSPLCVGKTIADMAVAKVPYRARYGVPTMPVMGANAPMTPAGTAVVGVAEILGGYVLAKSLCMETPVSGAALCAMMDMRAGSMVFVAPEVFAADNAICETMEIYLGLPCHVYGVYIDAKLPGMRSVFEKMVKNVAIGLYANVASMDGSLDQGKCFSPTQMILDHDMQRFLHGYTRRPVIDDDTLAIDAILEIAWDKTGYLMHDHTMKHMREVWESVIYGRSHWVSLEDEQAKEKEHLERAAQTWRDNLKKYEPPNHSDDFLRELRRICDRAREALL